MSQVVQVQRLAFIATVVLAACGGEPEPRTPPPAAAAPAAAPAAPAPAQVDTAPTVPPGGTLVAADFVVAGMTEQQDSAAMVRLLGKPDSVTHAANPFDPGSSVATAHYPALLVTLVDGQVLGFTLTGPAIPTARGLRVGDAQARVQTLYGVGWHNENDVEYADADEPSGLHVIRAMLAQGKVTQIYVGTVLD
jgi:hypothetical protein